MLTLIVIAVIVGVIAALICLLVGKVIASAGAAAPPFAAVGGFLVQFCWVIGLIVGLLYFVTGGSVGKL
jgi:hypothetical protein